MKYDVFISYSRKDHEIVARICEELAKNEISFFVDKSNINIGNDFPEVIADAILNSRLFLFIASENSYNSNFTNSEIAFAHKNKAKDCIIPYIVDNSTLPIGLDLVLSSTDFKTNEQYSINDLCRELSCRINKRQSFQSHKISARLLEKGIYWAIFGIFSVWVCLACVNSLRFSVFTEVDDTINTIIFWGTAVGWSLIFSICVKRMYFSLVKDDIQYYLLGLFGIIIYGMIAIVPCMTHSLYLKFCLRTDVKSEVSQLHSDISSIPEEFNSKIITDLELIEKRMRNGEIDVFNVKDAKLIMNVSHRAYVCIKEYYEDGLYDINSQRDLTRNSSTIEDTYSIFALWRSQFRYGLKMEFVVSMIISIIFALFFMLIIKKL